MPFTVEKLTPNCGAEIKGLDLTQPIGEATASKLRETLENNYVVIIRDQQITPQQQVAYARAYGEPESTTGYGGTQVDVATTGLPPEIMPITNDPKNHLAKAQKGAARWHSDLTWSTLPSKGAVLYAQKLPSDGAGTQFCGLYHAFEALPEARKKELERLRAVHSVEAAQLRDHPDTPEEQRAMWRRVPPVVHPLVWTHKNGRKSLILGTTMDCIVGLSRDDSEALRQELEDWCTQPQFVYDHQWSIGDILIWYNSATMHHAVEYTGPELRLLHRVTVAGEEKIQ